MAAQDISSICLTFKYRLLPSRRQHEALQRILNDQRELYNAALQERIDCYQKTGDGVSYYDQMKSLTAIRRECDGWNNYPVKLQRGTLKRLDEAFQGFFRRVKRGDDPGFPRFKGKQWFTSFQFTEWEASPIENGRIRFKGMPGGLRMHMHRPLPSDDILSAIFKLDAKGWHVCLAVRVPVERGQGTQRKVGIDVGISSFAALSTGETIPNPRHARMAEKKMRVLHRALSRCKRGSKRRRKVKARLARHHDKIRNSRSTYLHQVSARLVRDFDLIAIEKLNIKGLSGSMLSRDVNDAAWGKLRNNLAYKALKAGCELVEVDPKYTSQTCPECGTVEKKALSDRIHECDCGCVLDRDVAAARVILSRAVAGPGFAKLPVGAV